MADNLTFRLDVDAGDAVNSINNFFQTFEQGAARAKSKLNAELGQGLKTEIKLEFKNGQLVAKEIQSIKQESNRLTEVWKAVNGAIGKTPNELRRQKQILTQLKGDTQKYANGTRQVTAEWKALTDRIRAVDREQRKLTGGNVLQSFAGRFALIQTAANLATSAVMGVVRGITDLAAAAVRMETLQLQLEAFTGGAENAQAAFDQFVEIAANSPLNLEQVANAGKIMMAFGMETGAAIKATEQLAIVSAATGGDINLLARNMGQIVAQGRAYTRDLTQFAIQGIPIWKQLSVVTGESASALKDLAKEGKIGGAEVSQALDLMTQKGTAFYEIAQRMQETFAGRLARVEAAFQKLAAEAVKTLNSIDKAMGGPISNSMKLFADAVFLIANNFSKIVQVVASATAGIGTFLVVANFSSVITFLGTLVAGFIGLAAKIWAAVSAQIALLAAMGPAGWAQLAVGVGVAVAAFAGLQGAMDQTTAKTAVADAEAAKLAGTLNNLSDAEKELASRNAEWTMVKQFEKAREQADKLKEQLDAQVAVLKRIKEQVEEKYKAEAELIKENIDQIKDKIRTEEEGYKQATEAVKNRYDAEKSKLQENLELVREKYGLEIAALQERTPAEQKLYDLEKQKLQESIKSGQLDEEALLRAQARLERMEAQEKVAKLRKDQAAEEKQIQDQIKKVEEARNDELDELKKGHEELLTELKNQQKTAQDALKENQRLRKEEVKEIDEAIDAVDALNKNVQTGTFDVKNQVNAVKNLTTEWWSVERAARAAAAAIRAANAARNSGGPARASGGPVSGGSTYTVNELGKEAFLSASGKLSMINAPSFGQWKAPGRGTVIPAHLTNQLDIPKGGVNINKTPGIAAASQNGSSLAGLARAIASQTSGDTISNQVTIQSTNTNKTASDVLVQLAKLKRVKYS